MLTFKGNQIPCTVQQYLPGAFAVQTVRTHFAGLHGVSEINIGSGMRNIEIPVCLHKVEGSNGWATRDELNDYIRYTLNRDLLGDNGLLVYTSSDPAWQISEDNCTFEGYARTMNDVEDVAQTAGGGWVSFGVLRFTQLVK